jgi:hypothetical protein
MSGGDEVLACSAMSSGDALLAYNVRVELAR